MTKKIAMYCEFCLFKQWFYLKYYKNHSML